MEKLPIKGRKRRISAAASRKAEAGAQSPAKAKHRVGLAGKQARARTGKALGAAHSEQASALEEMQREVEQFRTGLLAEIGGTPSATQRALVLAATTSFAGLYRAFNVLVRTRRLRHPERVFDRATRLQSGLVRALRSLNVSQNHGETAPNLEDYLRANYGRGNESATTDNATSETAEPTEVTDGEDKHPD